MTKVSKRPKTTNRKPAEKLVSLAPLKFEEAVTDLLKIKRVENKKEKATPTTRVNYVRLAPPRKINKRHYLLYEEH